MACMSLCTLPDFAEIEKELCAKLFPETYSAPSQCSPELLHCFLEHTAELKEHITPNQWRLKSVAANPEYSDFRRFKRSDDCKTIWNAADGFNIKTRVKSSKCKKISCSDLDFVLRKIPGPQWSSSYCLEMIIMLVDLPNADELEDVIHDLWNFYLTKAPKGVYMQDIHIVTKLLQHIDNSSQKLECEEELYSKIFCHLKKGIRIKYFSQNNEVGNLRLALDGFAQIITYGQEKVRVGVYEMLLRWFEVFTEDQGVKSVKTFKSKCNPRSRANKSAGCSIPPPKKKLSCGHDTEPDPSDALLSCSAFFGAFETSVIPSILETTICIQCTEDTDFQYILLLQILRKLCENSYCIRSCVINSSVLECSLQNLSLPDPKKLILTSTINLIYSLVVPASSTGSSDIHLIVVPPQASFELLLSRFVESMAAGTNIGKGLRNHLACVTFSLTQHCPPVRQMFCKYLKDIAGILSNNILTGDHFELVLTSTKDDLELLQFLIWILELVIPSKHEYFEIIESYQLVPVMVRLLIGPCALFDGNRTDPKMIEMVMKSAWKILTTFAVVQPLKLLENEGAGTMLSTLQAYVEAGQLSMMVVEAFIDVLRLLLTCPCTSEKTCEITPHHVRSNNHTIMQAMNEWDAMETFTAIVKSITSGDNFCVSMEPLLCRVLMCCSEMGKYDDRQKEIFRMAKGVKIIIRLIHQLLYTPAHVRHMNPWLHIMVADCIRNCIADHPTSLEIFLLHEGMFRLLDLLEVARVAPAQVHILNAVAEMCKYSRCADQMMFWTRHRKLGGVRISHDSNFNLQKALLHSQVVRLSKEEGILSRAEVENTACDQSLSALLCELWRQEEIRLNVIRDEFGIIGSLRYPLLSEYARTYDRKLNPKHPFPHDAAGPATLDMMGAMRPKIALLAKILTENSNTEATVFGGLTLKNQVTIQIILNYIDLKLCEVYSELREELMSEEMDLVAADRDGLETLVTIYRNKVSAIIHTQQYLIQRSKEEAALHEDDLYNKLRSCQLQDHLSALREAQYNGTLSNYYLLVDKRLWQNAQIVDILKGASAPPQASSLKAFLRIEKDDSTIWSDGKSRDSGEAGSQLNEKQESLQVLLAKDQLPSMMPTGHMILPSRYASPQDSLMSAEEGNYRVAPEVLHKALTKLIADQKYWSDKLKNVNEETQWLMRKKWHKDWYPIRFSRNKKIGN